MRRNFLFLVLLGLPIAINATGSSKVTAKSTTTKQQVYHLTAQQMFQYVERVQRNPHANRAKAEAFLQKVLDGKATLADCGGKECTKDSDCCENFFCAGGSAGGRQCLPN